MNIFASARIKPENVKFPKAMEKLNWEIVTTYEDFCKAMEKEAKVGTVVLDAFVSENITGQGCAYALVETTCDKHHPLPTVMIVGPDTVMKSKIEEILAKGKRWVDINKSKGM